MLPWNEVTKQKKLEGYQASGKFVVILSINEEEGRGCFIRMSSAEKA
jgi:hypothetical protein